jgi:mono/diheme cytochrome c family protein/MFS family permease
MDFPVFHLDFLGNRLLIAVIAVLHVCINHPLAVGAMPLVTALEWWGHRRGDERCDRLAYRILKVCFIVTTTVGALTGVGIWLSTALVNPAAIGSLLRVFFWAWLSEWVVFVLEVVFIMLYFLSWKPMADRKGLHIAIGVTLSVFSWITMAIITAVLGFMMDPGAWLSRQSFLSGFFNPIYLPQLAFRTPVAFMAAGWFALFLAYFFTRDDRELRHRATRWLAVWSLVWLPLLVGGALWYRHVVPGWMFDNVPVALTTQRFTDWYGSLLTTLVVMAAVVLVVALACAAAPRLVPRVALLAPFLVTLVLLGSFERVREFVRKPYVIGEYMYANGIRADDYPLLAEEGLLRHAAWTSVREVTDTNRVEAGRELFRLACTRCHTSAGVNGVQGRLAAMYGTNGWDRDVVKGYVQGMHVSRPFMPPFPGTDREAGALADYLVTLQQPAHPVTGAQWQAAAAPAVAPAG